MKTRLLISFVLISCFASAQDWSPVNLTDKYNYRLDNDPVITQTTWQTNYSVNGSDTTFFFNTTFCDSCVTIAGDSFYAQRNLPRFFGYRVLKTAGGICNFRDPGSRMIELFAQLNDTWLFDTLNNVTAQVIFSGTSFVMNNSDSVKTLLLSSGDTVQFSKNYGITIWPNGYAQNSYYRLAGIHGRNVGVLVPRTTDYFDFNIGDMFEYESTNQSCSGGSTIYHYIRKYTITSANVNGDTTIYHANGLLKEEYTTYNPWPPTAGVNYYPISYDIYVIDSALHLGNLFNGEMVVSEGRTMVWACTGGDYIGSNVYPFATPLAGTRLFVDSIGVEAIGLGIYNDISYQDLINIPFDAYQPISQSSDTLTPLFYPPYSFTNLAILKKGLGQVAGFFDVNFEGNYYEHLSAYRKGNDTVGVFTTDDILLGVTTVTNDIAVNIYPNPSAGTMTVELPVHTNVDIHITDLQGRVVKTFANLSGQVSLQADDLADGIYLLQITSAEGSTQRKIVIRH
jgi:hypothetical protein